MDTGREPGRGDRDGRTPSLPDHSTLGFPLDQIREPLVALDTVATTEKAVAFTRRLGDG